MSSGARLVFACLGLALVVFPLTVGKPGLPPTLKADEPAYYAMASSLAFDGDLLVERHDLERMVAEYPYLPTNNLILMSRDGWRTTYYGKPFVYSLVGAPAVRLFGANGLVSLNMLLFVLMVAMGATYLGRWNRPVVGGLFAAGFFFLSSAFAYVFWMQPEIFNMFGLAAALHLVFHRPEPPPRGWARRLFARPALRALASGAAVALPAYNKPMLAAVALPCLVALVGRRRWREVALWVVGAVATGALLVGISLSLTGQASAYLGAQRGGVPVFDAAVPPVEPLPLEPGESPSRANSWTWIFRVPDVEPGELAANAGYFLWGRHTGLLLYMPFSALALLLFLLHARRSGKRWAIVAALATVAVFFLLWIPFNWHGGGGFVGNRYFVNVYPAFLFLVTRVRPVATTLLGWGLGGLLLGPIVFTPFGAPVPQPTLQAHVRNFPFSHFPLELTMHRKIPGYAGVTHLGVRFFGRKDVLERHGEEMWVQGGRPAELWLRSRAELESVALGVDSPQRPNRVTFELAGDRQVAELGPEGPGTAIVVLEPQAPTFVERERGEVAFLYRLVVHPESGRVPPAQIEKLDGRFYLGASLLYLGPTDPRRRQLYAVEWAEVEAPERVAPGEIFEVRARLTNASGVTWPGRGPAQVKLSYHWQGPNGREVVRDGLRTPLAEPVPPGATVETAVRVEAPAEPGSWVLVLDPVYEHVAWFSQHDGSAAHRLEVEVAPAEGADAEEGAGEGADGGAGDGGSG